MGLSLAVACGLHLAVAAAVLDWAHPGVAQMREVSRYPAIRATLIAVVPPPEPAAAVSPAVSPPVHRVKTPMPVAPVVVPPPVANNAVPVPTVPERLFEAVESEPSPPKPAGEAVYVSPSIHVAYHNNPPPFYPAAARRRGMEGVVALRVMVDANGLPLAVVVEKSSGYAVLDREALRVVERWRFTPARRGGVAVRGDVIVPIRFTLEEV